MAGQIVKAASAAITAASATGYLTVSTANAALFYPRAFVWVNASGQPNVLGQITEINTTTGAMGVKLVTHPNDPIGGEGDNYGRSDLSAYNGGTIYMDEQLIYNRGQTVVS